MNREGGEHKGKERFLLQGKDKKTAPTGGKHVEIKMNNYRCPSKLQSRTNRNLELSHKIIMII